MPIYQPFLSEWITFVLFLMLILSFVALSEVLRKNLRISGEHTRQMVHIGVGLLVFLSPLIFSAWVPPAVLAGIFIILNAVAIRQDQMKGMHTTERESLGTVFFPLTFLILILSYWNSDPKILMIGMLIMTISDPLASLIGNRAQRPVRFTLWRDTKTVNGSLSVFFSALFISTVIFALLCLWEGIARPPLVSLFITGVTVAIVATLSEAISYAGSDNLTLPLFSALMLDIMYKLPLEQQIAVLGWVLLSFALAFTAYRLKALTLGGAAGAMLLGSVVFSIGGIFWVVPMATFFVLSSILSKIGKLRKTVFKAVVEKGSQRDILQVYANGGVSLIMAVAYFYTGNPIFFYMFLGSLAAATADTWGTEIGIFAKYQPRHILTFSKVPMGTSGGVTLLGTSGFFMGAGILTLSGIIPIETETTLIKLFILIAFGGILGALTDSILGATVQAQYRCPHCGKITEKLRHCGDHVTALVSGYRWIDNDVVNFICTLSGALYVLLFYHLLL